MKYPMPALLSRICGSQAMLLMADYYKVVILATNVYLNPLPYLRCEHSLCESEQMVGALEFSYVL